MFRTRDFVLFLVTGAFLVIAISATLWQQQGDSVDTSVALELAPVADQDYTATVVSPETISREERLAQMREKIAESGELVLNEAPATGSEPPSVSTLTPSTTTNATAVLDLCPDYAPYAKTWPATGVSLEVVEGARLAYVESTMTMQLPPPNASGTSQTEDLSRVERTILAQLPIRFFPSPVPSCIPTDVIGVAKDGSLIRNNESGLYGVFGADTLIGYALDGFPIYGVSGAATDNCGGATVAGQYRYYLSAERETVLSCFSATPISI